MKIKKLISIILAVILTFFTATVVAGAEEINENTYAFGDTVILFENGTSDFVKEKIIADFTGEYDDSVAPCGLTCTLFGHKLDTGYTTTITHKKRASAPRCLSEKFYYELCSRCDYSNYTLLTQEYIYCCS